MSLKEKHAFSEKQLVNQRFLVCYGSVIGILLLAYIGEYIKGNRTPGYLAVFCTIMMIPFLACMILYFVKNKESAAIKYIGMGGYLILYAYAMFTSDSIIAFVLWKKWETAGQTAVPSSIMKLPWQQCFLWMCSVSYPPEIWRGSAISRWRRFLRKKSIPGRSWRI